MKTNSVTLSKTVVVATTYYRDEFENEKEWNEFLDILIDNNDAEQAFYDGIQGTEASDFCDGEDLNITYFDKNEQEITQQ